MGTPISYTFLPLSCIDSSERFWTLFVPKGMDDTGEHAAAACLKMRIKMWILFVDLNVHRNVQMDINLI